jgi:hypothetical protein
VVEGLRQGDEKASLQRHFLNFGADFEFFASLAPPLPILRNLARVKISATPTESIAEG